MAAAAATSLALAPPRPRLLTLRFQPHACSQRRRALPSRLTASAYSRGRARPRPQPASPAPSSTSLAATGKRPGVREYVEAAREMARRPDGRPPRWFSPVECGGERVPGAPTLLYLPEKLQEDHYTKAPIRDEDNKPNLLQHEDAGEELAVPVARRRRIFLQTMDRKTSPGGREVAGPRTPQSLHPAPAASSSSSSFSDFISVNPDPPPRGIREGESDPNRTVAPRDRKEQARHRRAPASTADGGGIDGVGLGLIRHHERLSKMFEMWCLHIPVQDRTTFERLVEYVERTVRSERSRAPDRPVYLVGESVGACIALAVAARNRDIDLVLILVNPGTSFHKSQLQSLTAFLDLVPDPFHLSTPQFLNFLTGNFMKIGSTFDRDGETLADITTGLLPSLMYLADILPKESIVWKMKMLRAASSFVNSRLHAVKAQTLVLASGNDELLPSREEAERLNGTLQNCRIRHFKDNGHKILLEDEFYLSTIIKGAGYYRRSRQMDFVSDFLPPTPDELKTVMDHDSVLSYATDPVMLSTMPDGKIVRGLAGLPREGPVVLVGYHMLMGFELGPLVTGVLRSTGIHIRGLAHPFLFSKISEQLMPDSSHHDLHRIMGAVPVTPVNFYKLLSEKQFVLLYPGGAREALHRKGEEYKLFWPEQSEFVRMASRFGATIIPFGVVGEDDICHMLLDYNDLQKLPFYDILDKRLNEDGLKLRTNSTGEIKNQDMHPVVLTPKVPGRFYFVFGKPIETRGREKELRDKEKAGQLYLHVKSEVESCIEYLKEKREEDPYRSILQRLLYQAAHGSDAEIPTFEP